MSVDKLVDSTQLDADLTSVANAIRTKGGTSASLAFPADFVSAIAAIPSGGGGAVWTRPADWPNLDNLDISGGNILYLTYMANEANGFCDIKCKTSSGQYTVEVGTISGSTFTADYTQNFNSNNDCQLYFGSALGGYKVIRVTGNITYFTNNYNGIYSYNGQYRFNSNQGMVEARGKLQNSTSTIFRSMKFLEHLYLTGGAGNHTIRDNNALIYAELPYFITSSTTSMSNLFYNNIHLVAIDTTGWDTSNVTNFELVFYNCADLKTVDVSGWNVKKGTSFSQMFYQCRELQTADVSDWETNAAASIKQMFQGCDNLREIDVSGWDVDSVTNFNSTFYGCSCLTEVDITQWDMSSATDTNDMFRNCQDLGTSLVLPATLPVVGSNMFNVARQLFEFHFTKTSPPTLTNTNAFANMTDAGGKKIYVPYSADHSVLNAYKTASNWSTYASYIYEEAAP